MTAWRSGIIGAAFLSACQLLLEASPEQLVEGAHCQDGADNDGDDATDCEDTDCASAPACIPPVVCGDGVRQAPEVCDGEDLGGQDCASLGFLGGALTCTEDCAALDDAACFRPEDCQNNQEDDGDGLLDCADPDCALACQDACNVPSAITEDTDLTGSNEGHTASQDGGTGPGCFGTSAPEVAYAVDPPLSGTMRLTLSAQVELGVYVRTACDDQNSVLLCHLGPDPVELPVTEGVPLFVIVDGRAGDVGDFFLSVRFLP